MHKLANLSAAERRRMVTDFIDDTFAGIDVSPGFLTMMRGAMPDLPVEPTREQSGAWVELAELVQDPGFRASLRQTATAFARSRADVAAEPGAEASQAMAVYLRERAGAAAEAGIEPGSAQAGPIVDDLVAAYARHFGRADGPGSGPGCWSSWNQAATGGTSGTGSCWRSSTAGPPSRPSCPRPNG